MSLLNELLDVIHSGDAPNVGELNPSNLVDDYYMRLVNIIESAQRGVQPTVCWACNGQGIIRADGIAINCPVCNPAHSG